MGLVDGIITGISSMANTASQMAQFEKSLAVQQEQFDRQLDFQAQQAENYNNMVQRQFDEQLSFQKSENEIMREREDTAVQRRAADLKAAGINPLIAGGGSGASAQLGGSSFTMPNYSMASAVSPGSLPSVPHYPVMDLGIEESQSRIELNLARALTEKKDALLKEAQTDESRSRIARNIANVDYILQQTLTETEKTRFTKWLATTQNVEFERAMVGLGLDRVDLRRADEMSLQELELLREQIAKVKAERSTSISKEVRGWVTDILDGALSVVDTAMKNKGSNKPRIGF